MLNEETLSRKFVRRGFWLYFFTFLAAPLGYIIKMTLSRDLSIDELGLFYGIISLLTLLSALNDLGGTESLNYFLPRYFIEKDYAKVKYLLKFVFKLQAFTSIAIISVIYIFADYLGNSYFHHSEANLLLKIFALFFLGTNLVQISTVLFSATQNTKFQKATEFIRLFSTTIFVILLFFAKLGTIYYYTLAWISGLGVAILFSGWHFYKDYYRIYLKNVKSKQEPKLRRNFIKYAIPTFLTANIGILFSQIDAQMVIGMLGNENHAYYSNYLSIMTLPFIVLSPIIGFLFPVFTELHTRKQNNKILKIYKNMTLYMMILSLWISFFMWQNGTLLAQILFGEAYKHSGIILQYSVPFLIFNLLNQINFQLMAGTGQAWARTVSFAIVLPINIILNYIFISKYGVEGSALAVGLSWIPLYFLSLYSTRKYFAFPKIFPIIVNIIAVIVAFFISYEIMKYFNNFSVSILLGLNIIIYAISFFSINFLQFREALKIIKTNRS